MPAGERNGECTFVMLRSFPQDSSLTPAWRSQTGTGMGPDTYPSFGNGITSMRFGQLAVTVSNYIDGTGMDPNSNGPLATMRGPLAMTDVTKNDVWPLVAGAQVASGGTPMLFVVGGFGAFEAPARSAPPHL